ncbi:hypothetical protein D1007_51047 [Hordeum vulgare]|nr:hypothetical protein D1007_51047 [Hordeum vulgare]
MHHRFANAVDGVVDRSVPRNYLQLDNGRAISHADLRLRSISLSIFAVDEVRANMNWETVRRKAWLAVSRLADSTPELRGCIALPATGIKPHHLLPIASGQQLMVPSIGSLEEAKELLADLLDESVRPGVQLTTYGSSCPLQPGRNEGAQFCQPIFGTSTEAKTSGTLSNAGANQHMVETCWDLLDGRTISRVDPTAAEQLRREVLKLNQLTGTFVGASPVVSGPGAVANLGAKPSGLGEQGLEIVVSNAELQMIKRKNKDTLVLNLLVRACPPTVREFEIQHSHKKDLSPIVYQEPVVFDPSEPPILVVDQQGVVSKSQYSSSSTAHAPAVCTQESRNLKAKLKEVHEEEEEEEEEYEGFDVYEDNDACPFHIVGQIGNDSYYMSVDEDVEMEEEKRQREEEEDDEETDGEQSKEEEVLHYEGHTEVEELFELEDDETLV